jgi:hypothetical protein
MSGPGARGDFLTEYRELSSQIRKIERERDPNRKRPPMELPEPKDIRALMAVKEILYKLQNPPLAPPTEADKVWTEGHRLHNEVAVLLDRHATAGVVKREDFEFPTVGESSWIAKLHDMKASIDHAVREHNLPPHVKTRRAQEKADELEIKLNDALLRLSALEQELSRV